MMDRGFQWWPEQASSFSGRVDALFIFLCSVTAFFTLLIFVLIVYLSLKYRRRPGRKPQPVHTSHALEPDVDDHPVCDRAGDVLLGRGLIRAHAAPAG
jgi:heme/copper-type cytochrome/quinol oxidase subunit 2